MQLVTADVVSVGLEPAGMASATLQQPPFSEELAESAGYNGAPDTISVLNENVQAGRIPTATASSRINGNVSENGAKVDEKKEDDLASEPATVMLSMELGIVQAGENWAFDSASLGKAVRAIQQLVQKSVVKAVNEDALKASATLKARQVENQTEQETWTPITETQVRVDKIYLLQELKRSTSLSARIKRALKSIGTTKKAGDPSIFLPLDLSITGDEALASLIVDKLTNSDVRIAVNKCLDEHQQLSASPNNLGFSNIKISQVTSRFRFHDSAIIEMVVEVRRADRAADNPRLADKSGDKQLEMILRTDAMRLDALRDAIAEMAREVGCIRDLTVSQATWASSLTCGLVKKRQILRDFGEESVGKEVTFDNKAIVDWSKVDVDMDNLTVSHSDIFGHPKAILVDFTVELPIEPFTEHWELPAERLTVIKSKTDVVKSLNKHFEHFQNNPRARASEAGEVFKASAEASEQGAGGRVDNLLQVDHILHRGLREERSVEVEVEDDVFFDFLIALKRHLRTSEADKTVGRHDTWDNLSRCWRLLWSLIVSGSVFWFTLLILMTISSSGLVGFDQGDSDPFYIAVPVRNVTPAQRVAGRDAAGTDIADICQGFIRSVAASFEQNSARTGAEARQHVLEEVQVSSLDHLRALAEEGILFDKQGRRMELDEKQREQLKWEGTLGFNTAVDRMFPSPQVGEPRK